MILLLWMIGAVLPLGIAPHFLFHFDVSPKTITLGLAVAIALFRAQAIPAEIAALWSRRGGRALCYLVGVQVLWLGVATATSIRPELSLLGSNWRQFGFMTIVPMLVMAVLMAAHFSLHPQRIRTFLRIAAVAGIAASAYGVAQYFDFDPFQASETYQAHAGDSVIVRPPGTLGHADYFAWWLAIEFFCGLAVMKTESPRWRAVGMTCMTCTALATLLSGTRAALVAIAIGAVAYALLSKIAIGKRHIGAVATLLLLLTGFYFSPPGIRLRARAAWSGEEPAGGARPLLWRDSLRMAVAKPLLGFGPETFQSGFGRWESEELARLYPDFHHESPQNVALDALIAQGVPGVILMLAWVFLSLQIAARAIAAHPVAAVPLAAALGASVAAAMFDAAILAPLLLTLLVLASLVALEPPDAEQPLALRPWLVWAACPAIAVCFLAFSITDAATDFHLAHFQRAPSPATRDAALRWQFTGTAEDIYCSRILLNQCESVTGMTARIECWREAEQVAARAINTAGDTGNAWYNLAVFTAAQNDVRGTEMALRKGIEVAPNWFKPHWTLARLLFQTGDLREANAQAERAATLDSGHHPEVLATLEDIRAKIR